MKKIKAKKKKPDAWLARFQKACRDAAAWNWEAETDLPQRGGLRLAAWRAVHSKRQMILIKVIAPVPPPAFLEMYSITVETHGSRWVQIVFGDGKVCAGSREQAERLGAIIEQAHPAIGDN